VNRYQDAMFMQTEQLRFLRSAPGVKYMQAFDEVMREKEYDSDVYGQLPENLTWTLACSMLEQADPIYISPNVLAMIDYARESFDPEPVLPTDLFTACGFAYLPRPVYLTDVNDDDLPIRAVGWLPMRASNEDGMESGGVWVMMWTHRDDDVVGRSNMTPQDVAGMKQLPHGSLTLVHNFWLPYNVKGWETVTDDRYKGAAARQWGLVQVLWRIGSQVVRTVTMAPRHARKDAKRHGVDREHVTVIQLRKQSSVMSGGSDSDRLGEDEEHYSVQFVVRGHWRNQWYASLGEHRQIWILPHVKGPEDAPFQPSKRVFELVR
jgi:hypothetical protein